jgi:ATP-dependent DNA helicase RecG
VRRHVSEGRQAYLIFPLVEESDKIDAKAAVDEFEVLNNEVFPDLKLGLVHGRLKSEEKETVMRAFYAGELDILVATSVIEVGVDVPNSTVMVIEGANRFGLAQLHQFRGRVGRGEHQSYCVLIADESTEDAEKRLTALEETNDGFLLAEKDLELRGPGEFFGRRQSGLPQLSMASLLDLPLLKTTQEEAAKLFAEDPDLALPQHEMLRQQLGMFWEDAGDIS